MRFEQTLAEHEASRKRDHEALIASNAAVMATLATIRGLPADHGGGDGGPSKKRKEKELENAIIESGNNFSQGKANC